MNYEFKSIEAKWQQFWAENQTFKSEINPDAPKCYVLDMFPYPSGAGLHVGHPLGYIASDIYARFKRHQGFNVLHPQGYDSFGLPAEQYAIQTGQHPAITTETNINRYRQQLDKIGFSFDWSREVRTSSPEYYKWTQWIFGQLFESWYNSALDKAEKIETLVAKFETSGNVGVEAICDEETPLFSGVEWNAFSEVKKQEILLKYRIAYLADTEVNWCPVLGTVLANDEIVNGVSERGGHPVVRKKMTQWSMRISAYANRFLEGLNDLDWSESIKETQRNWIGKSVGAAVSFNVLPIQDHDNPITIDVFTTRPDTIFGVSFMTLAPEHPLVAQITTEDQKEAVTSYIEATAKRSERDRMSDVKTISGVFTGAYAEHPFTKKPIPVWIGDYVLASYGTGAVMAVPCGDQRDYDFAKHFGIAIPNVFKDQDISETAYTDKANAVITNSDFLNNLPAKQAAEIAIKTLEVQAQGKGKTQYRLRDAVFSRQRYWGEPFPVYYVDGMPQLIDTEYFPIHLPDVEKYLPTETGEPPLGRATIWAWDTVNNTVVENAKIDHKTIFPLELNTMPGWAGSSWYLFRYMNPNNTDAFASKESLDYWGNVDLYIGGSEHATGHLLYARFWTKFLYDLGYLKVQEPFQKMINQGMILGESAFVYRVSGTNKFISKGLTGSKEVEAIHAHIDFVNISNELDVEAFKNWRPEFANAEFELEDGKYIVGREVEKMSKSKFNVVNPDAICEQYGADTLRLYEMFLGPLEQAKPWSTAGITGVYNFLKKLWKLYVGEKGLKVTSTPASKDSLKTLHKTIDKVTRDIENFSFNTSVSTFMIAVNELTAQKCTSEEVLKPLCILLAPYAPHISEELWSRMGGNSSILNEKFPLFDEKYLKEDTKTYPVSFNGKMRFKMELSLDLTKEEIQEIALKDERTIKQLNGREPKKIIVVPGKIINFVG